MNKFLILALLLPTHTLAETLSASFPQGKGSTFKMFTKEGAPDVNVSIYIASTREKSLNIEYFMTVQNSLVSIEMWQQFEVAIVSGSPAQVTNGYVQTKELQAPEQMPHEYLQGFSGVKVNNFLFPSKAELDKNKVGEETIEVPAGRTKCTHYRTSNNGQTVDYWISEEAKPIGMVKLVSTNEKDPKQNYGLELMSLMDNVKPFINPSNAVPLSDKGKSFLAKPESVR